MPKNKLDTGSVSEAFLDEYFHLDWVGNKAKKYSG